MTKRRDAQLKISEPMHRGISTTLTLLDEHLCEIEQWANGREQQSVLYREHNTLTAAQRSEILCELSKAREILRRLRDSLSLSTETCDAAARVVSLCSAAWPNLVELQGKHLKRYGEPSEELRNVLTPEVDTLIALMSRIADISKG